MRHWAPLEFFTRRWQGQVPLARLFWRDMLVVGSLVNLGASLLALVLMALGAPLGVAVAVHFVPLPYNFFLFAALWQLPGRPLGVSLAAVLWLAAVCLL